MGAKWLALGALLAGAMSFPSLAETAIPAELIRQNGRAEKTAEGWITSWTGTSWRASFTGTGIGVVTRGENFYAVRIDGRDMSPIGPSATKTTSWYRDLGPGSHEIEVIRRSGQTHHRDLFAGFVLEGAEAKPLPAPAPRPRRILVLGDSSTTGYGANADSVNCDPVKLTATTDFTQSYPYKIARAMKADFDVAAAPAAGLNVNCCGEHMLPSLTERYFNLMPGAGEPPQYDLIILALGGVNNWVRERQPALWAEKGGDQAYGAGYAGLIRHFRAAYGPQPLILAMAPLRDDPATLNSITQVVADAKSKGDQAIEMINLKMDERGKGCHSHMTGAQNAVLAEKVLRAPKLNAMLGR